MRIATWLSFAAALSLAACTGGGPRTAAILDADEAEVISSDETQPYVLVDLSPTMAELVSSASDKSRFSFFPDRGQAPVVIGSGDVLDIAIVLSSENGFVDFTQNQVSPLSTTRLPAQEVGSDGNVNVPPIGRVNARGQTVQQFERFLTRRLGELLVEPSVIVSLTDRRSSRVSVLGSVNNPGAYSINQDSRHLLDVITLAGGPSQRSDELLLSLSRKGATRSVPMVDVYGNQRLNIHVQSGDVVTLDPYRTRVNMIGAAERSDIVEFDEASVDLADVLSDTGGLISRRADRQGVFIYRETAKAALASLGASTEAFEGDTVPTIYRLDLSEPTSFFAAQRFAMQDGDLVYISDSLNEEIRSIFGAGTILAPAPAEYVRDGTL